jgi:hypothetical protein
MEWGIVNEMLKQLMIKEVVRVPNMAILVFTHTLHLLAARTELEARHNFRLRTA